MTGTRVLITGGGGMLARALSRVLERENAAVTSLTRHELDVTRAHDVERAIDRVRPDIVIQCAAYTNVDAAESDEQRAFQVNAEATARVAAACGKAGARFVFPSTDYVFDGAAAEPYRPEAEPRPLSAYGRSKLAGEIAARTAADYMVVRTCWLYGEGGRNFVRTVEQALAAGKRMRVVTDQVGAPTWTMDIAETIVKLVRSKAPAGVYHATNAGTASWYEFAREIALLLGYQAAIEPCLTSEYQTAAQRPAYSVLDCTNTDRLVGAARDWRLALADAAGAKAW